jgi:thioredoxin-dependent peroxiredoxin
LTLVFFVSVTIAATTEPTMLSSGQSAPPFTLPDADMELVSLSSFAGKNNVVLYFYPKDGTPGCTIEASDFSDLEDEFAKHDCVVIGISRDDCLSHADFRDRHGLSIQLLADPEGEVCEKYGVWQERETDGVKRQCLVRSTFIIDKRGIVCHALYAVSPRGHAAQVANLVRKLERRT